MSYYDYDSGPTLGDILGDALRTQNGELTVTEIGKKYNEINPLLRAVIDGSINGGQAKLYTIKYLRQTLNLGLSQAKQLYEAREKFLTNPNEYGFIL